MAGTVRIGVSGWQYESWKGDFYPQGLPPRDQLGFIAGRMDTVELNGPFYSLQRPTSYQRWHDITPADFVFAVKGGRFVTHFKRLIGAETALANFFASGLLALDCKLGPILWQLPARVPFDPDVLDQFLGLLPRTRTALRDLALRHDDKVAADRTDLRLRTPGRVRHALEVRSNTFDDPRFFALLEKHGVACVTADSAGRWPVFDRLTAEFGYLRLHGHSELYASRYQDRTLARFAEQCQRWAGTGHDVYVYFDNDSRGHAPYDAVRLREMLGYWAQGENSSSISPRNRPSPVDAARGAAYRIRRS